MDQLIENIYQAAYSPELWPRVMQDLARCVDAASATILHRESTCPEGPLTGAQFGNTPAQIESYAKYFRTVDHRFLDVQKLPVGGVLADDHNSDFDSFIETEIYQDFWKPAQRGRGMAGLLFKDAVRTSIVSARRYIDHGPFTESEVQTFQQLLPHLRRSFQFRSHLHRANVRADALAIALDQFPIAVFLLDRNCNVLDHNDAARQLLTDLQCPIQIRQQRLVGFRPAESRQLQKAVCASADSLHTISELPCFLRFAMRDGARLLVIMPIPITRSLVSSPGDLVLLFCRETTSSYLNPVKLQHRFGFTPAEARLAAALAEGLTLEEFATTKGISVGTARAQLKSAMEKADVHTQAQLVGTILRSLAALVRGI